MTEKSTEDLLDELEQNVAKALYEETVDETDETRLARSYSFTALSTAVRCPREYVCRYVIGLPDSLGGTREDDSTGTASGKGGEEPLSIREGRLFHTVVEHKWPVSTDASEWKQHASKLATARGWGDALPRVERLIDSFLASPVSSWDIDPDRVEVRFSFDFYGRTIAGHIDAIPLDSTEAYVVLDHKTGTHNPNREQLLLYVLATHLDDKLNMASPATKAAFLRVDNADEFTLDWLEIPNEEAAVEEAKATLKERIKAAEGATLDDPSPGPHCASCAYRGICDAAE
ncbi:RecB family exonuclease [Salinigranum halophilum]|uniref:RecB family exonuclease n=1 Tax=Salinigranum halophilum TaxID=2565931 RepID=UPI0010A8C3F4|nr:PD-(D/E)XK nuclease family protein [Salinigranum halophilum]